MFNYNEKLIIGFGGSPAALMKSGCTITTLIAVDRIFALYFPMKYYVLRRRRYFIFGFALSATMAAFDWVMLWLMSPVRPSPSCPSFACFTSTEFRTYWGLSNTAVNFLSCLLTIVLVPGLNKLRFEHSRQVLKNYRQSDDKSASRVAIYILIISAIFGVIPGTINGCAEYLNLMILNDVGLFIGVCASISGLSHAFIFGMAHRGIRSRLLLMFGRKTANLSVTSVQRFDLHSIAF
uniref:G_PROTEIN_RECEP_F1_2 domain-containing protein n=1 Tax=Parascaris univalens TaxID=6257 RepID=A0A915AAM5_PARUN